jgi:hypothetical protein
MPQGKTVAIIQSNYIPWKGYFDIINMVDEFILFDEVQYTKRDWRNRNKIKTPTGAQWLTIPVLTKSKYEQPIESVEVAESWAEKHWRSIESNYRRANCFDEMAPRLKPLFEACEGLRYLSEVNYTLLRGICDLLDIKTPMTWSRHYAGDGHKTERLLAIRQEAGADLYISGPAAKAYLDVELFRTSGIDVNYMDYDGYPAYRQLHGDFDHYVSIVDLVLNTGGNARDFMKSLPHE